MSKSLKILFFSNSIFVFAASLLGPLYAVFVGKIDNTILSISVSWFAFLASTVIFTFFTSLLGDKFKETEYLLIGGYIARAIAWSLYIYMNSLTGLVFLQIFLGFGEALGTPSFDAIFAKHLNKGVRVKEYSRWKIFEKIAGALGVLIGGFIVSNFGFTPLFVLMSFIAFMSAIIVFVQPRNVL